MVFVASNSRIGGAWYFDSACSRHMTGSKDQLTNFQPIDGGMVTYGSVSKGKITGIGTLNVAGIPKL